MTQMEPRASSLHDGTHTPTRTWHSPWAVAASQSQNDASLIDSPSHHRPSIINVPSLVQPIAGKPVKRWNFRKANLELFTAETERRTLRCEEEHPTRIQQTLYPRMGRQLQPSPARAPAGHHQGRHRHNGNSATPRCQSLKPSLVFLNRASYGRRRNNDVTSQEREVTVMLCHNLRTDAQIFGKSATQASLFVRHGRGVNRVYSRPANI